MSTELEGFIWGVPVVEEAEQAGEPETRTNQTETQQEDAMSMGVSGDVAGVEAAGGAVLIGAAAALGVGVAICYMAGVGLVSGAQAIHDRCQAHAARRRAWDDTRKAIYRRAREAGPPERLHPRRQAWEAARQQQAEQIARLAATRSWLSAPLGRPEPFPLPPLDEAMRVEWPEPGELRVISALDQALTRDRLSARHRAARRALSDYEPGGAWEGLFSLDRARDALAKADSALRAEQLSLAAEHLRLAERLVKQMENEAVERWRRRAEALNALQEAAAQLQQAGELTVEYPETVDQLEGLNEIMAAAQKACESGLFVEAEARAQVVRRHGEVLTATPQLWQREMLLGEIAALREEIAGHGSFPAAEAHLQLLDAANARLAGRVPTAEALTHATDLLDQVSDWADQTLRRIETTAAGTVARMHLATHAAAQMEAMGYTVEWSHPTDSPPLPEEKWRLTGRRPAPGDPTRTHTFIMDMGADGHVWFDATEGYRGKECDDILAFIRGLQARGVQGYWEPFYSAEQAAALFREMFSREGYNFYEEATAEGLVYTLFKGAETIPGATIAWDGRMETTRPRDQAIQGYIDRVRAEIEEAHRQQQPEALRR